MKTIAEQYADGYHGALFTVEAAEDAWRLAALERFLAPSIREQLSGYRHLINSCDNRLQLAGDALAMSRAAADYSELRQALFFDSTQHGEEPPWRLWGRRGSLAVRIRPRLYRCEKAALVLTPGQHEVPPWARAWLFTVVSNPHDPQDDGTAFPVTLYRTFEGADPAQDSYVIDAPKELEEHGEWYRQLFYAFRALGLRVQMGAVTHEDFKRRVFDGPPSAAGKDGSA
ncbi:hypothetical protein ACFW6V_20680 [Streptomyces sp. NPDC058734]|uniref:hypothetical protein n=1 Tax=Streptomyces sp. NPDC058734 TaxID=3346615 RepID=UPI0036A34E30